MPIVFNKDNKENQPTATSAPMAAPQPVTPTVGNSTGWGGLTGAQLSGGGSGGMGIGLGGGSLGLTTPQAKPKEPDDPAKPSAANGFGDQSSLTPQTANQAGTGFVNLSRVLGANLGAGAGLVSSANKKLGSAFAARTGAEADYRKEVDKAKQNSSLGSAGKIFRSPDILANALDAGDIDNLSKGLKGLDVGKFGYNAAGNADMQDLRGLGNAATAGRVLAKDAGVTGQYAPKLSALDSLIYGGNSAAAGAVADTKTAYKDETKASKDSAARINTETDRLRQTAAETAARNAGTLRGIATNYITQAQQEADAANADRNSAIANGIMRDEFGNEIGRVDPNGPAPVWEGTNANATAGNFYRGGKDAQTIAQLLGDPSLVMQNTGPYQRGVLRQDQTQPVAELLSPEERRQMMLDEKAEAERMKDLIDRRKGRAGERSKERGTASVAGGLAGGPIGALVGVLVDALTNKPKKKEDRREETNQTSH